MSPLATEPAPATSASLFARGWFHLLMGAGILGADYLTGPYLQFPILFVAPVALAAWYHTPIWAYGLAVVLPLGRLALALNVDVTGPMAFAAANAGIRIAVLVGLAYLVIRTARQTRLLEERVSGLVRVCAWSRTVEYRGEWLSFEEYLKRRFKLESTHGVSPDEMRKLAERVRAAAPEAGGTGGSGRN